MAAGSSGEQVVIDIDPVDPTVDVRSVFLKNLHQKVDRQQVAQMCADLIGCSLQSNQGAIFANGVAQYYMATACTW